MDKEKERGSRKRPRMSRKEQKQRKKNRKKKEEEHQENGNTEGTALPSADSTHTARAKSANSTNSEPPDQCTKVNEITISHVDESHVERDAPQPQSILESDDAYVPTPIPPFEDLQKKNRGKALGSWFPNAIALKSKAPPLPVTRKKNADAPKSALLLFYQYVDPLWPESVQQHLIAYLSHVAETRVLGGRFRVAREGVNATISSLDIGDSDALTTLHHLAKDLQTFDKVFLKTDFKFIPNLSGDRHFKEVKIFPVQELVFYGLDGNQAPLRKGGRHLSPHDFHEKLKGDNTVVVDVRNHYEAALGRFDGQEQAEKSTNKGKTRVESKKKESADGVESRAKYIDPKMRKSTDFVPWLQNPETQKQLDGKEVLLFCTGGVRCERASAHLNHTLGSKVKGVYQLQGGIERYLQAFPEGGFWRGKNFVFDKREAFGVDDLDGDGGVVRKSGRDKKSKNEFLPEMKCCKCAKPWDRYVGKKKCDTCGVPVLMCDQCLSESGKPSKVGMRASAELLRCPLCVEQSVTVRADDVEWTDNGVKPVVSSTGKTAPSVLKWGGGHAQQKKEKRRTSFLNGNNPL